MLHDLSGHKHSVYTGVCLRPLTQAIKQSDNQAILTHHFSEKTDVYFRELTDDEITHYVDTYRPFDKAGAYGIQEWIGMVGISRIEGCYYNVMGLPLASLWQHLQAFKTL